MIGVYAVGGGAGHVTRARRVIDALDIRERAVILATPSDLRAAGGIPLIEIPRGLEGDLGAHRNWLRSLDYERMIIDTFPAGIQGELAGFDKVPLDFIGRLLRVDEYRKTTGEAPWPRFENAYEVEEGAPRVNARTRRTLTLSVAKDPPWPRVDGGSLATLGMTATPHWLIVHSGPPDEVEELIAYTRELTTLPVLVATPCDVAMPAGFTRIDAFPAHPLFPFAERIVSAAGFNVMLETEPWREKHIVLPFPRRFDDQFARARTAALRAACARVYYTCAP